MKPLLCEFHAHTTWSDGELSLPELVELYGRAGFDVLCVTDHTHPAEDPWAHLGVRPDRLPTYFAHVEVEAELAWKRYRMLVLPGLELTVNAASPDAAAHAVAVGLRTPVTLEDGIEQAMKTARDAGAAIVAAHPAGPEGAATGATRRFWRELDRFAGLVDRWELINGHTAFPWVAEARLPVVANGDFHRPEHLSTWKTLLPCEHEERAILDFLRSKGQVQLTVFDGAEQLAA
jgi:processive 1,2-diacylglycerol beta-glucosyltransferase